METFVIGRPHRKYAARYFIFDCGPASIERPFRHVERLYPAIRPHDRYLFYAQHTNWKQIMGIILGLIGCIGLLVAGKSFALDFNIHALWVVLATLLYGINMHIVKTHLSNLHPLTSTSGIFMMIGPIALSILGLSGFFSVPVDDAHIWPLLSGIGLGLLGSAIGMLVFNQIIKWTSAVTASSVTYMIPIVALAWGTLDGESIYFRKSPSCLFC